MCWLRLPAGRSALQLVIHPADELETRECKMHSAKGSRDNVPALAQT